MELAKRRFFIPAARTLMGAIYDSKYLSNANLVNTAELVKLLEDNRDVPSPLGCNGQILGLSCPIVEYV